MDTTVVLSILFSYFFLLLVIAYFTGRKSNSQDFFIAQKKAPWYLVAFGMIGSSLSGVTFISIPGAVFNPKNPDLSSQFSYFQVVLGYLLGYLFIGTVLMPLYYRLNLISIYSYLEQRLGIWSYKTGAFFFLLSRTLGAALRIFLAASVLQLALFDKWGFPFEFTAFLSILLIWIYTFKGGIKTIIWTDTLQTAFLVIALVSSIWLIKEELGYSFSGLVRAISLSPYSKIFFWEDITDNRHFVKQFFSGVFIAIAMTGLDQDLMQKNLSCKNIKEAQKNMFWFCIILVLVNILFLALGALLYLYATHKNIPLPLQTDKLYPMLAFEYFGLLAGIAFLLGITAATYASADAALASLTTSFCIDFLSISQKSEKEKQKAIRFAHIGFSSLLVVVILIFKAINDDSVINSLFKIAGYTYGPLLGLYAFGLFTQRSLLDKLAPLVCVISPLICFTLSANSVNWLWGYRFGFELLILNGLLTFVGLWLISYQNISNKVKNMP